FSPQRVSQCDELRTLRDGLFRGYQPGAENCSRNWLFPYEVNVDDVIAWGERIAERQLLIPRVFLQGEMLIANCGCAPNVIHCQHDKCEIEIAAGSIRYLY